MLKAKRTKMLEELINRKVLICVGEPWDFVSDAGENTLIGSVCLVSDKNRTEWLRCHVSPFIVEKNKITSVVAVHRYANQSFESLLKGEKITCNFLYEPTGKVLDSDQITEILRKKKGMDFLVGSIILAQ